MKTYKISVIMILFSFCITGISQQKQWHDDFHYRAIVQVKNTGETQIAEATVMLNYFLHTLIKTGKIKPDATDIALIDQSGNNIPIKICKKEKIENKVWFKVSEIPPKKRRVFYLYYGNPEKTTAEIITEEPVKENPQHIVVSAGAEESLLDEKRQFPRNLEEWLKKHNPEEFDGKIWVRFRIDNVKDYRYNVVIDSEINPYAPARLATGTVSRYGLHPRMWTGNNDWGKPIAWYNPIDESDWLNAGEYSCWVELPVSKAPQWFTNFIIFPEKPSVKDEKRKIVLHLEFATQPSEDYIFHTVDEEADYAGINYNTGKYDVDGIVTVRMPTKSGLEGLKEVGTFTEYTMKRLEKITSMNLSPPPQLSKLVIGTWLQLIPYRMGVVGEASLERAEKEFKILSDIGINSVTTSGIKESELEQMFKKYNIIDTTITGWAGMWRYTSEAYSKKYDYMPGETSIQRWTRVFDDYYSKLTKNYSQSNPVMLKIAKHFNTGDEIGPATTAGEIKNTPQLLEEFRQYLKKQNLTPESLGQSNWESVYPETDRKKLLDGNIEYARIFYHTKKFINDFSVMWYKAATDSIKKYFPQMRLIAPNFQAGPMQFAFIGNNNDMNTSALDLFELGRNRAFEGIMMEDWVYGWDAGIGRICFGADIMRASARKFKLPMASYLVGGEAIRAKLFAYLMAGIKENLLYLYGPIGNIGPAWADSEKALAECADVTRKIKKFEDEIYSAQVRPAKIAQLVAFTSDIMQAKGLYFCPERQNIYTLLKHCYFGVDIVSEQDITQENILQNYSVLFITDPNIRQDTQKKIVEWVSKGGKLIAIVGAGFWDEYNQPSNILTSVFGVKQIKMIVQEDWLKWSAAFYSTAVSKFAYKKLDTIKVLSEFVNNEVEIDVWGAKIDCQPIAARIIGRYSDGKPAIFINRFGKGQAIFIGALLGESYVRNHWNQNIKPEQQKLADGQKERDFITLLLERIGVKKDIDLSVPGVYSQVMDFSEGVLVFLNNASGKPIEKTTLTINGINKVTGIDSLTFNNVQYHINHNSISMEIPLENVEIIRIRTKKER